MERERVGGEVESGKEEPSSPPSTFNGISGVTIRCVSSVNSALLSS